MSNVPLHLSTLYEVFFQFRRYWAMYWEAGVSVPEFRRLMAERAKVVPARKAACIAQAGQYDLSPLSP